MTAVTGSGMSTQAIGIDDRTVRRDAWRSIEPWHLSFSLALLFAVLAVWSAMHDAPAAAVVYAFGVGWTGSTSWIGRTLR